MEINSWPGLIAVILAVISFYGTTYLVIALNVGWRFGYWLSSATFGALMVLLSIFWIVNPVGPQGTDQRWAVIAAGEAVSQGSYNDQEFTNLGSYPGGGWETPGEEDERVEAFSSTVANCLTSSPDSLSETEAAPCTAGQELLPFDEQIPIVDGTEVPVTPEVTDVRFLEDGATLAQARIVPLTRDPRVADNPETGEQLAPAFQVAAVHDQGTLRVPAYASLAIFLVYFAIHIYGLHRAEQRKLSPAVT